VKIRLPSGSGKIISGWYPVLGVGDGIQNAAEWKGRSKPSPYDGAC